MLEPFEIIEKRGKKIEVQATWAAQFLSATAAACYYCVADKIVVGMIIGLSSVFLSREAGIALGAVTAKRSPEINDALNALDTQILLGHAILKRHTYSKKSYGKKSYWLLQDNTNGDGGTLLGKAEERMMGGRRLRQSSVISADCLALEG